MESLLRDVENSELSSIRQVVTTIISTLANPSASVRDLKQIVEIDPPLAARILKLANSAFYSRGRSYGTIEDAIILLGFEAALRVVLSQKVCDFFQQGDDESGPFSRRKLWLHSTATALLSRLIHRRELGVPGETAYVCGLLHDVGLVIADQFRHEEFAQALAVSFAETRPLGDCVRAELGYDHGDITLALASHWRWPAEVVDTFQYHRHPFAGTGPHARTALSLFVANQHCHMHELGHGGLRGNPDPSLADGLGALRMQPAGLEILDEELRLELAQLDERGLLYHGR
jgi:putative nucleotidyltransferase with HDIG domain